MADSNEGVTVGFKADIAPFRDALSDASRLSGKFAGDLTRAFEDAALKGRSLSDVLKQLAFSLSRQTLEAALSPITSLFGTALSGLLGGLGGAKSPVVPHAQGGVIASPIAFPLGGRRLGLAGEAGPEAILPLTRGRDGRLGVRAEGAANPLNITFNVTAQDAQSFRRSEGQIAAMLSRAVGRGQRNL
jgi:phage-related minor tail protein